MIRRMTVVRILACLAAAMALNCAAAPIPAAIGNERLVLDAPAGYSDSLQLSSPRLQELAETLAGPSNRVMLLALTDGDLRAFMQGDSPAFRRYMVIATPTRLERERVDAALFASTVAEGMRDMGKPVPPDDYIKHLTDVGFGTVEVRARRPYRVLSPRHYPTDRLIFIESVEICAIKDPMPADGPCVFTGKTAIYFGDADYFDDDKGHFLTRNQPLSVCDKTAGALAALGRDDIYISGSTWFYDGGGCC